MLTDESRRTYYSMRRKKEMLQQQCNVSSLRQETSRERSHPEGPWVARAPRTQHPPSTPGSWHYLLLQVSSPGAPDLGAVTTCQRQRRGARFEQCSVLGRDLRGIFKYLFWTFSVSSNFFTLEMHFLVFFLQNNHIVPHISSLPSFSLVVSSPALPRPPHNEGDGDSNPPQNTFQFSVP